MTTLFMPETHDEGNIAHHLDHLEAELMTDEAIFCISEATRASLIVAPRPRSRGASGCCRNMSTGRKHSRLVDRNLPTLAPAPLRAGHRHHRTAQEPEADPRRARRRPTVASNPIAFVVLGKKGWLVDDFLAQRRRNRAARIVFSGFVSEFVKYRLLKGAQFLVLPSLCEGFGIPALEAMSLGKPVLASRSSSLPEVVGDAGIYFDPISVSEFADALAEISDPRKLAELSPRALNAQR